MGLEPTACCLRNWHGAFATVIREHERPYFPGLLSVANVGEWWRTSPDGISIGITWHHRQPLAFDAHNACRTGHAEQVEAAAGVCLRRHARCVAHHESGPARWDAYVMFRRRREMAW